MHVMICWEVKSTGPKSLETAKLMKAALDGYSWVRPIKNVYIVKVATAEERGALKDSLIAAIKESGEKVHLVITPPMAGGGYTGWLPRDLWERIDQRTK